MSWKDTLTRFSGIKGAIDRASAEIQSELGAARAAIAAKRQELERQGTLLPPPGELIATVDRLVTEAADRYRQESAALLLRCLAGQLSSVQLTGRESSVAAHPGFPWSTREPLPFEAACAIFPGQMKAGLAAVVRSQAYEAGVPMAERPALLERLASELAALERAEEALVDHMRANGLAVEHRPDVTERRTREARAAELAARRAADQAWIEEQKRAGHLGTPRVHTARMGGQWQQR